MLTRKLISLKQNCISRSREARLAQAGRISYQNAVATAFSRRQAFATCKPFSALVLGQGSDFLYQDGILSYLRGHTVRIINVHESSKLELVIDLRSILGITDEMNNQFKLMHHRDNILAILWTQPFSRYHVRLAAFDTMIEAGVFQNRLLLQANLPRGQRDFVRNDSQSLIYGAYTTAEGSGSSTWKFWAYNIARDNPRLLKFNWQRFSAPDIGSSIVFEVVDGYFYIITSQVTVDAEGQDPTSYYGGCRYNLCNDYAQNPEFYRFWRRQSREGPIHDLWTDLMLTRDENGGRLLINESRREWHSGYSKQRRTFYTAYENSFTMITLSTDKTREPMEIMPSSGWQNEAPEDDTLEAKLSDEPNNVCVDDLLRSQRIPRYYHPEYPPGGPPGGNREFNLSNTRHRAYNFSCSSFLDIVLDDRPAVHCPALKKLIRLRIGSRVQGPPLDADGFLNPPSTDPERRLPIPDSEDRFIDRGITLWPSLDAPAELIELINANSGTSNLKASSDERSIIYKASSRPRQVAPIVLVNFDPTIRFPALLEEAGGNWVEEHGLRTVASSGDGHACMWTERAMWFGGIGLQLR